MSKKRKKPATAETNIEERETRDKATASEKIASKKAAVLGTPGRNHRKLGAVLTCLILFSAGIYFIVHRSNAGDGYVPAVQAQLPAAATETQFTYPVALFADGNARHYEYKGPGATIKYFIVKSSDGVIRAAYDACDVCWRAGKGYYQVGDEMICKNCGQRFPSVKVNEVKGGCNPSPLRRSVQGDDVVIRVADILEGSQYFNFSGRS